jgi:predicted 3-demethylubiquinone-9 3-methyltransferase (glyoxalase superfamily)
MSDKSLTTCLWFDTEGEGAARFYCDVFEDSKLGRTVPYGEAGRRDADMTMLVEFELNGQKFIALNGGPQFQHSEAISFQVPCENQEEVDYYWERLTEGGEEGPCGWLKDRFGVSWQVVPSPVIELMDDPDPGRAKRAAEAVYDTMGKIDIATVESAAAGERASAG